MPSRNCFTLMSVRESNEMDSVSLNAEVSRRGRGSLPLTTPVAPIAPVGLPCVTAPALMLFDRCPRVHGEQRERGRQIPLRV